MSTSLGFRLSRGVVNTISSPISTAVKWADEYGQNATRPVIDMSRGAPGIHPPKFVHDALGQAASSPSSFGYGSIKGEMALREAFAAEMRQIYGPDADIKAEDIALSTGCNMAYIALVMSLADAGDEVILTRPWYFNYHMDLTLLSIKPVPLDAYPEDGFLPSVERCRKLITAKTKAITLITPNNPTGAIYPPSLIASFAELAKETGIALIVDETYRDFITTGPPHEVFNGPWRANFVHLFSFSKSYCLPGHRLGAIVASPELLTQVEIVLDCIQICAPRPMQIALAPLLQAMRPYIRDEARAINARHELFKRALPKEWILGAQGGYFAYTKHPFIGKNSMDVSRRLALELGVVTLPAEFFLDEEQDTTDKKRWMRFSVGNVDDDKVKEACERLKEAGSTFGWEMDTA